MNHSSSSSRGALATDRIVDLIHHGGGLVTVRPVSALVGMKSFSQLREATDIALALAGPSGVVLDLTRVGEASSISLAYLALLAIRAQQQRCPLEMIVTRGPVLGEVLARLQDALGAGFSVRPSDDPRYSLIEVAIE